MKKDTNTNIEHTTEENTQAGADKKTPISFDTQKLKSYLETAVQFVSKYRRYFLAGILFLAFVLLMIFGAGKDGIFSGSGNASASGDAGKFEKNKHKDVRELIENYYDAYATGDTEKLTQYAEPVSMNEMGYISVFSQFVENYHIKNVYTQQGVEEGSYLVSVEMAIKFKDVETEAPGLDFFYVETGVEDKLYINNIYSQFNMQIKEYITDERIMAAITAYEKRDEVKALQVAVQEDYAKAVEEDEQLSAMISTTVGRAVTEWMATITIVQDQIPPQGNLSAHVSEDIEQEDGTPEEGTPEEGDGTSEEEQGQVILDVAVTEQVQTKDKVNIRTAADTTSNVVTTVEAGTVLNVYGIDSWGGWTCVIVSEGVSGYIRNDFLTTIATEYSVAGQPYYPAVGQTVVLNQDQNVMTRMYSDVSVIANLKLGTSVTVEMSYANGWSKIAWDNMVGYVPTAVLKLD